MPKLNLHELTGFLVKSFLPAAVKQRNLLVNNVPADIYIDSDGDLAASIIGNLVSGIVCRMENSCIRLTAKIFDNIILLTVTDGRGYNDCGIIEGFQGEREIHQTIALSFPTKAA